MRAYRQEIFTGRSCNHIGKFLDMAQGTQEKQAHILIILLCFYHIYTMGNFEPKGAKKRWLFLGSQFHILEFRI